MSSEPQGSHVGRQLGAYRIETMLGEGAMGEVYRGVHEALGRPVAIKTLKAVVAHDRDLLGRFFAEARAVNKIRHEHIVECTDLVSQPDGTTYMVMELLEGQTLADAIKSAGCMDPARAVRIAAQVANALSAAHEQDIVHRDVKPANIFLIERAGTKDYVKVLDFGIARLIPVADAISATQTGAVMGTPAYMSPEQVRGERVMAACDIYSLGVVLFEMLAGRLPFEGKVAPEIMVHHLSSEAPAVSTLAPNVPPALSTTVSWALQKSTEDRPRDMIEFRSKLLASVGLENEPSLVGADNYDGTPSLTGRETTVRNVNRGVRQLITFAMLAASVGAGLIALFLWQRSHATGPTAVELRKQLTVACEGTSEPSVPKECRTEDRNTLTTLLGAAELLRGGSPGAQRPEDLKAAKLLTDAKEPATQAGEYWQLLARAQLYAGQDRTAAASGRKAIKACESSAAAHGVVGTALFRMGQKGDAEDHYRRALELDGSFLSARFNVGLIELANDRTDAAIIAFDKVVAANDDYPDIYVARGQALLMAGRFERAAKDLERATADGAGDGQAYFLLGAAYLQTEQEGDAQHAFCKSAKMGFERAASMCKKTPIKMAPAPE